MSSGRTYIADRAFRLSQLAKRLDELNDDIHYRQDGLDAVRETLRKNLTEYEATKAELMGALDNE